MVEVYAEILRGPGSPVYLTGEEIECEITFKNIKEDKKESSCKTLAWACAQISCQCYLNDSRVLLPKAKLLTNQQQQQQQATFNSTLKESTETLERQGTSFLPNKGENGLIVYSSKPKILFCDLKLDENVSKSFIYREKIPYDLPPSYKGQYVKYLYKITIGTQKLNCSTQLLRVPFRVIAIKDFHKHLLKYKGESELESIKTDLSLTPPKKDDPETSPFLIIEKHKEDNLEFILEVLQDLTARKNSYIYNVTNSFGKVVKLTLLKLDYKIGDEIIGMLDFSDSDVACAEYMVTLTSEEVISDECKKKPNQLNYIESYSHCKEFVLFIKNTSFTLQVPVLATSAFQTYIVSLKWRLNFDFMISTNRLSNIDAEQETGLVDTVWQVPNILNTEKMSWSLPINIHPTSPLLLSNASGNTDVNKIVI